MANYFHLSFSPEFAEYLRKNGQLEPLIWALKDFKERQNFPFQETDKRIIKQSLMKAYTELLGKLSFSGSPAKTKKDFIGMKNFLLDTIEVDVERIYGGKKTKVADEFFKELHKKPEEKK